MSSENPEILFDGFVRLERHAVAGLPYPVIVLRTSDSVAGLLYDRTHDRVLLVRQKRVPMRRTDNPDGSITELVAGRFDVNLGPKALLVKEAQEEAGVTISEGDVRLLNDGQPLALSAGVLTERCYLAYAEIGPDQIAAGDDGWGLVEEGEDISRVWVKAETFCQATHECTRVLALALYLKIRRAELREEERMREGQALNQLI